ncbi:MAG: translation initiation factor IF-3 [Deltaproteobacteria bacterium GWC2_55_46]|nr:MAG: translation initiation factor IF-3 [Deltaproteobacteria bacterium GWA2_55_82]OIJ72684.1 MAG: translation initiation factor IF-3 [Deltaproteobacteria bacterium GWC2_55_46]
MIRVPQVRVIDAEGNQLGVMATRDAITAAEEVGMDLVEVAATANPPVCRIMDYGKFKYQTSKKTKEAKKKQTVISIKEVKLRGKTGEHDFQFKLRNVKRFLGDGDKVKISIIFKGREITHTELGMGMLKRVAEELKDVATIEAPPKLEGRNMSMLIAPAPQKAEKTTKQVDTPQQKDNSGAQPQEE